MILFALLVAGISTMAVPGRWALSAFQVAMLGLGAYRVIVRGVRIDATAMALAAIVAWGGVQLIAGWTVDAFRTQEVMLDWAVNLVGFALALELAASDVRRERFLTWMLAFAAGLGVVALVTASFPEPVFGPFVYRNQYAAFVEALLPVALVRAFLDRDRAWLYAVAIGLMVASVVASGSRTGAVLCSVEVLLVLLLMGGRGAWRVVAGIVTAVAALTLVAGPQSLWSRFHEPHPYSLRWDLLRSSIDMWWARPLTGWGLGTWSEVYPGYARYDDGTFVNQAHNDWAQWLVEGGLPLFLLVLFVVFRALRPVWKSVWGLGIIGVFIHCLVDYPMQQRPILATFFFVMLGMVMGSRPLRSHLKSGPPMP